jgi:hypothetical protein
MCSLAARGLWADMLALMHEATPYGHLLINGKAPDAKQLAALVGARPGEVQFCLNELDGAGVFSRTAEGVVYSRRMVRDRERSTEGREAVQRRWAKAKKGQDEKPSREPIRSPSSEPTTQKPEARSQRLEIVEEGAGAPPPPADLLDVPPSIDRRKASHLPADWTLCDEWRCAAEMKRLEHQMPAIDVSLEAEKFRNYWHAKSGQDGTKRDWRATWINWVLNARGSNVQSSQHRNGFAELIAKGGV